jgi:hypothetical protein
MLSGFHDKLHKARSRKTLSEQVDRGIEVGQSSPIAVTFESRQGAAGRTSRQRQSRR